ncbi:unnamed protein product [Sphagnum troendelagicum]
MCTQGFSSTLHQEKMLLPPSSSASSPQNLPCPPPHPKRMKFQLLAIRCIISICSVVQQHGCARAKECDRVTSITDGWRTLPYAQLNVYSQPDAGW